MKRIAGTLVVLTLLGLAVYVASTRRHTAAPATAEQPPQEAAVSPAAEGPADAPSAANAAKAEVDVAKHAPEYYPPLVHLNRSDRAVEDDLRILGEMFHHYQMLIKDPSGNPVGDNAEIVRALQGRNRAALAFMPAQHPALNAQGEMVDRWGTPFFFHALSGHSMEIRSAGPDRKFWTDDDAMYPRPERSRGARPERSRGARPERSRGARPERTAADPAS